MLSNLLTLIKYVVLAPCLVVVTFLVVMATCIAELYFRVTTPNFGTDSRESSPLNKLMYSIHPALRTDPSILPVIKMHDDIEKEKR